MQGLISGRSAVVTGAAQGIGLEIARLLHEHGADVVLADRDEMAAAKAAQQIAQDPDSADGRILHCPCDVTDEEQVDALAARAMDELGRIDIWVNNAGIAADASLRNLTSDDFMRVVRVNLFGTWLGVRAAASVMRDRGGSIVNMSSLSGKSGNAGQTNYSAAKAGVIGLTKSAAKELASKNVRVNAVQPGLIRTPMTAAMTPAAWAEREAGIPMRRAGEPREVAGAVLFLASPLASYITGSVIEVGGGRLM